MMLGEGLHVVVAGGLAFQEFFHVGEQRLLFIAHVAAYLMGISVIEFHDELSQRVVFVERFLQLAADIGQLEVDEIGMAGLKIMQ